MRLTPWLRAVVVIVLSGWAQARAQDLVAKTEPLSPEEEKKAFRLPPGFEAQLVASEPDILKPMNLAFDARGRLWVTDSVEYPYPAAEGAKTKDGIRVIEGIGPDGKPKSIKTFAADLNIPIGILPLNDGVLAHSIPNIWKFAAGDGDRAADKQPWYRSVGFRDTHGMASAFIWGFDGWIYGCHGFANESSIQGSDGQALKLQSGNTYRFRADGSHIEPNTWGQVNPFGLSFDSLGNLYSCDCHSQPVYQLLRGAYYPSFGKPHDGLGFGPEMTTDDHGSTGIAGIAIYEANQFPEAYRGTAFIGNPVTSRINHDKIAWTGASPKVVRQPDFLVSDDPWFRPVDIELGPDGALYVADFYNRIIGHYEVPLTHPGRDRHRGRIWRIVYRGPEGKDEAPSFPRADWRAATVTELIADLAHPNLAVRTLAANELSSRGESVVDPLKVVLGGGMDAIQRVHAAWVLQRLGKLETNHLSRLAAEADRLARVHAMKMLAERTNWSSEERALGVLALDDPDPLVKRNASDALGRHPDSSAIRPLLELRRQVPKEDTHLLHVVRMALRDQLKNPGAWEFVGRQEWPKPERRLLADVTTGVPTLEAARFLLERQEAVGIAPRFIHHIARYGDEATDAQLLKLIRDGSLAQKAERLRSYQQGNQERGVKLSDEAQTWAVQVVRDLLGSEKDDENQNGIDLAGSLKLEAVRSLVETAAREKGSKERRRQAAIRALVAIDPKTAVPTLGSILEDVQEEPAARDQCAQSLAGLPRKEAREFLVKTLPLAPSRLQLTIAAGLAGSREGAAALLEAISAGKASARLIQEPAVDVRLTQLIIPGYRTRAAELTRNLPPADVRMQERLSQRKDLVRETKADPERGALAFKNHCAACHQLDGQGSRVGPQLDGVGVRGIDRLLEDLLDPNRNVDQAFRATNLALKDGRLISGLVLREEGQVIVIADNQGKEQRIDVDQVEERRISPLSPMPANFNDQVPEADLAQLIAYLLTKRETPKPAPDGPK